MTAQITLDPATTTLVEDPRVRWRWGTSGTTAARRPIPTIIAIANQKGGVGKTTTAVNLASYFALHYSTLLVDLDSQANATTSLGVDLGERPSVYDVLVDGTPAEDVILDTVVPGLSLLPSSPVLSSAELQLAPMIGREFKLQRALQRLGSRYDYIFIDCPPALSVLALNALCAADKVIVPMQAEYLALEGFSELLTTIGLVQTNLNPLVEIGGIVLTMSGTRTNLSRQIEREVRERFSCAFQTVIPRNIRVAEAPGHGLPLTMYAPESAGGRAYRALAEELMAVLAQVW